MPASLIIAATIVILLVVLLQQNQRRRNKTQGLSQWQQDRVHRLNRLLQISVEEPDYPNLPPRSSKQRQRSKNENSKKFQEILNALRQSHPHQSEAWRWDEAHRQMGRQDEI
jgi:uncharacterized protein YkwD